MSWPYVQLGEVAELINGDRSSTYPNGADIVDSGILFLNTKNIVKGRLNLEVSNFITKEKYQSLGRGKLKRNDLVITLRGSLGNCCIFNCEYDTGFINAQMMIIRVGNELSEKYLFWYLSSSNVNSYLKQIGSGSAVPQLTAKQIRELEIPLPPLKEQQRIAAILDKADAIRRKRQQVIDMGDQFLRSVFLDMFGEPVSNTKKWEVRNLKDISTKILSGSTPKGGSKVYVEEGIVFFRSQNVWRNKIVLDDIAHIDKATHRRLSKSSLKNKDLLMTKTGRINTENSSLGRAAIYLGDDDSANINGHVYLIRLQDNVVNEFVLYILTTNEYRDYIRRVCVGGIDKRQINKVHLEEFPIIYPPIDMQQKFADYIHTAERQKKQAIQGLKKSEELFLSLSKQTFVDKLSQSKVA